MKLLTHNMLTSNIIKGVKKGYPLLLQATSVKETSVEFNADFIKRMINRIEWPVLYNAADAVGQVGDLPKEVPSDFEENETFLKQAHRALMEIEIDEGSLECPETGRKFQIKQGIPNMLLNEDEI